MKFEIRSRWNSTVSFTAEAASLLLAVEAAVKSRADLSGANLSYANLTDANLYGANLRNANLYGADLRNANLRNANLSGANLSYADLSGANLRNADLSGANLYGANLSGVLNAELALAQTVITSEGNLVGWKKCQNNVIVKLLIPQHAKRSNATGRKCRASEVKVLRVFGADYGVSTFDKTVIYRKGKTVKPSQWNEDRWTECGGGIHFFLTRIEAENYN